MQSRLLAFGASKCQLGYVVGKQTSLRVDAAKARNLILVIVEGVAPYRLK